MSSSFTRGTLCSATEQFLPYLDGVFAFVWRLRVPTHFPMSCSTLLTGISGSSQVVLTWLSSHVDERATAVSSVQPDWSGSTDTKL